MLRRRPKPLIALFTLSVLVAVSAFSFLDLMWRRERALDAAEARTVNLTNALGEYFRGTFAATDSSLRQLAVSGRRIGGAAAPAHEWLPMLHAAKSALNEVGSISVVDASGIIRHSTLAPIVGQSRADRYVFEHLRENDSDETVMDEPFDSPVMPGLVVLPAARRLETPDGRFDGIVVSVVDPERFRSFLRTVNIGRDGAIWVLHGNGRVLFREPSTTNPLGRSMPDHPLLTAARSGAPAGTLRGRIEPDGPATISGYRMLTTPRALLGVSLGESDVLAEWRTQVRNWIFEGVALAGVLGVLVLVLFRSMDAKARVETELAEVQRTEAERLMHANQRLEEALQRERRAREESETASRLKDEFLMTLSHELRTPLNAIVGWIRMLATDAVPAEQRARALATIERNAHAQTRLVEDLLDVSRAISGKLHLQTKPINVAEAVLAATETLRPALEAKRIAFDAEVDRTLPPIIADPDRVQQVVWNLLSNALKFTPAGGRIALRVAGTPDGIEIVVRDSGAGIAPAFLPFVFDRFRQADAGPRREQGGLGLGLSIARHLVELHGGTIEARSDGEGRGAEFRIHLPQSGAQRPVPSATLE